MNHALVDSIVKAVLYEGYMLYPYRPSAVKNRQRFNFGVVYPRGYSTANHAFDAYTMQTECLIVGSPETHCTVRVRFLRMVARTIAKPNVVSDDLSTVLHHGIELVPRLTLPDRTYQPWQEAVEETIEVTEFALPSLARDSMQWPFRLSAKHDQEPILDHHANIIGFILRDKRVVAGTIEFSAESLAPNLFKLKVLISNDSPFDPSATTDRELALERSLVSAHTVLSVRNGEFVSRVDPPDSFRDAAHSCQNVGTWPILVGAPGERDTMLSSPIILYDYPEIAPESPGDLFDGAEIDEILSLRIMTMTDEEKREMRESDERARQILERTESLPEEQWMKLHGALRGLRAARGETS